MPLQIRRGNTAERLSIVPLQGEPIFDTDLNLLYIGNGATAGGQPVTGVSLEESRDSTGSMLANGQHTNIEFIYGTEQDENNRIDARVDLSDYDGVIKASAFNGSLVADDSTELINAVDGSINLNGTVRGDIIPDVNEQYDLGSSTFRFKDLYLSGTSLFLGDAIITSTGTAVNLPIGSTIAGTPIGTGSGTGDGIVEGSNYNINIVADDSTLLLNSSTKTFTGNFDGNFDGDIRGSVFTDDSVRIIDGTSGRIESPEGLFFNTLVAGSTVVQGGLEVSGGNISLIGDNAIRGFAISGHTDNDQGPIFSLLKTRGSLASPTVNNTGDRLGNILFRGFNGTEEITGAGILSSIDSIVSGSNLPSNLEFVVRNSQGTLLSPFKILNSGIIQIKSDSNLTSNKIILTSCHHDSSATTTGLGLSRSRGTIASPSAIQTEDMIYNLTWGAYSGTAYRDAAIIRAVVDGTVSSTAVPGRIELWTSNASGTMTKNAQLDKDGVLRVDQIQALNSTLSVTADLIGSVYSDSSTMLIDGTDGTIKYYPVTPGDWNGTAPATVGEALDRLATAVKALNTTGA